MYNTDKQLPSNDAEIHVHERKNGDNKHTNMLSAKLRTQQIVTVSGVTVVRS